MKLISIVGIVAAVIAYVTAGKMRSVPSGTKPAHGHDNKTHGNNTLSNSTHGNHTHVNATKKQRKF